MQPTGIKLHTDMSIRVDRRIGRRFLPPAVLVLAFLSLGAVPAGALDLFTLWQRPELPLNLEAGQRADYRRQALADGRRTDDLLRIQCLGQDDQGNWLLEVLPLLEPQPGVYETVPGEGLLLVLNSTFAQREGGLFDAVVEVKLWRDGKVSTLDRQQWRRDPLVTASFSGDFDPDTVEESASTIRVIDDHELECRQLIFSATDNQKAELPVGTMIQTSTQEVSAAVHPDIPLLGLAYVTERVRAESRLDPPSDRMKPPPPQVRIEILECFGYGHDAVAVLGGGH